MADTAPPSLSTSSVGSSNSGNSNRNEESSTGSRTPRPCVFFAQGMCRNGNNCKFSHDRNMAANVVRQFAPPPPPIIVNIPPGQPVYSIDVECVATGIQHNARSIAQVAMVDEWSRPIFSAYIKQDVPVVSYLTKLTGITKEIIDQYGLPFGKHILLFSSLLNIISLLVFALFSIPADVMQKLRSLLPPNAILVGQSIHRDIQWLQLVQGIDYHSFVNLSDLFRVWNPSRGTYTHFTQDHCAKVWLNVDVREHHDAVTDAAISISLFNAYRTVQWDPARLFHLQCLTMQAPRIPGFSTENPVIDGCW
jgi:DNA polymerase III epsilon subunit-like protein